MKIKISKNDHHTFNNKMSPKNTCMHFKTIVWRQKLKATCIIIKHKININSVHKARWHAFVLSEKKFSIHI